MFSTLLIGMPTIKPNAIPNCLLLHTIFYNLTKNSHPKILTKTILSIVNVSSIFSDSDARDHSLIPWKFSKWAHDNLSMTTPKPKTNVPTLKTKKSYTNTQTKSETSISSQAIPLVPLSKKMTSTSQLSVKWDTNPMSSSTVKASSSRSNPTKKTLTARKLST